MTTTQEKVKIEDMTLNQLRVEISRYNEMHRLSVRDEGYVPTSGKKSDLIERLSSLDFEVGPLSKVETEEEEVSTLEESSDIEEEIILGDETNGEDRSVPLQATVVRNEIAELKIRQIIQNPINPREPQDYHDPSLQRKIVSQNGLTGAIVVRPTGEVNEHGEEIYVVIDGNRRRANLLAVLKQGALGGDTEEYKVNAVIRETEGDDKTLLFDELTAIYNANESGLDLSPVGKLKVFKMLLKQGATQSDIATRLDVTPAYISKMMVLEDLPDVVLQYVHFGFNAERIEASYSPEEFELYDIPYKMIGGKPKVLGIGFNNAVELGYLSRRVMRQAGDDWDVDDLQAELDKFISESEYPWTYRSESGKGVISAAIEMSTSHFKRYLDAAAKFEKLLKPTEAEKELDQMVQDKTQSIYEETPETETKVVETETVETETVETKVVETKAPESKVKEGKPSVSVKTAELVESLAADLESGSLTLSEDWAARFADDIRMGDTHAVNALNYFIDMKILVEK